MGIFIFLSISNFQVFYSEHTLKKSKTSCILKLSIKILAKKWYCHVLVLSNTYSHVLEWFGSRGSFEFSGAAWQSLAVSAARAARAGIDHSHTYLRPNTLSQGGNNPACPPLVTMWMLPGPATLRVLPQRLESSSLPVLSLISQASSFTLPFVMEAGLLNHVTPRPL